MFLSASVPLPVGCLCLYPLFPQSAPASLLLLWESWGPFRIPDAGDGWSVKLSEPQGGSVGKKWGLEIQVTNCAGEAELTLCSGGYGLNCVPRFMGWGPEPPHADVMDVIKVTGVPVWVLHRFSVPLRRETPGHTGVGHHPGARIAASGGAPALALLPAFRPQRGTSGVGGPVSPGCAV